MNCSRCNAPLIEGARFCRNCGLPFPANAADAPMSTAPNPSYSQPYAQPQVMPPYMPTQQVSPTPPPISPMPYAQPFAGAAPTNQQYGQPGQLAPPAQPGQPEQFMQQAQLGQQPGVAPRARKRRWPRRTLISILVLIVLVVGGWFLVGRPLLHAYAQGQLDQVISSDVGQILPVPPPINSLAATETQINNLIVLNSPSGPVTNAVIHIAPPVFASDGSYTGGVQLTFSLYGFSCSVSAIPQASNGEVIVTHVQVSGIIAWVMSADELTTDLNSHLHDVGSRLLRTITSVTIKNREVDIGLG